MKLTAIADFSTSALFGVKGKVGTSLQSRPPLLLGKAKRLTDVFSAVVTGGGSGIGSMIASAYVQNGAKVYIASRKEQQLKEVSCHMVLLPITR